MEAEKVCDSGTKLYSTQHIIIIKMNNMDLYWVPAPAEGTMADENYGVGNNLQFYA